VPVARYKLYVLLLSAAFTSLAGSLYSLMVGFIDPESGFGILRSVEMIIIAALGGAGTLFGPLLGSVILIPLQTVTNSLFGGGGSGLTYILYGGIIVILARFEPGGLLDLWHRASQRWARRRETVAVRHAA
jgi:branched-chain amino acid transport system permease protein